MEFIAAFDMVDIETISFYPGLKIEKDCQKKTIKLLQPAYIQKIFTKYYLDKANPINIPMKEIILEPNFFTKAIQVEKKRYQKMTGLLMFLIVETQSDIAFAIAVTT